MGFKDKEKGRAYYKQWRESEQGQKYKKQYGHEYYLKMKSPEWLLTRNIRAKYHISIEEYSRMMAGQNFVCGICEKPSPKRPLGVDHNHKTGKVRGLLCNNCNYALGMLKEDLKLFNRAIEWLKKDEN